MAFPSEHRKKVMICSKTDVGLKRKENEDHFLVIDDRDEGYDTRSLGMLFAVAESRLKALKDIFHRVHLKIYDYSQKKKAYDRMRMILSALIILNDRTLIAHVGDSRIYRLRDHCLEKLTQDHTMAQLSVEMGYIAQEDAERHPLRHVLMDVLGQGLDEAQTRMEIVIQA